METVTKYDYDKLVERIRDLCNRDKTLNELYDILLDLDNHFGQNDLIDKCLDILEYNRGESKIYKLLQDLENKQKYDIYQEDFMFTKQGINIEFKKIQGVPEYKYEGFHKNLNLIYESEKDVGSGIYVVDENTLTSSLSYFENPYTAQRIGELKDMDTILLSGLIGNLEILKLDIN